MAYTPTTSFSFPGSGYTPIATFNWTPPGGLNGAVTVNVTAAGQVSVLVGVVGSTHTVASASGAVAVTVPLAGVAATLVTAAAATTPPYIRGVAAAVATASGTAVVNPHVSASAQTVVTATGVVQVGTIYSVTIPTILRVIENYSLSAGLSLVVAPNTYNLLASLRLDVYGPAFTLSAPLSLTVFSKVTAPPAYSGQVPNLERYVNRWSVTCRINRNNFKSPDWIDVSLSLTGTAVVDIEEGAARVCRFSLKPSFGDTRPELWLAKRVEFSYVEVPIDPAKDPVLDAVTTILFNGFIDSVAYDPATGVTSFTCSDLLSHRFDKMSRDQISSALPGTKWSSAVFGDPVLTSEYAKQRLSTYPGSADLDVNGNLRLTGWSPAFAVFETFDDTKIIDNSLKVSLASLRDILNYVKVTFSFRYPRLFEMRENYVWDYFSFNSVWNLAPSGWEAVARWGIPVVGQDIIRQAIEGTDWNYAYPPSFTMAPKVVTYGTPLGGGVMFIDARAVTGAQFTLAKRWQQTVDEEMTIVVSVPGDLQDPLVPEYMPRNVEEASYALEFDASFSYQGQHWEDVRTVNPAVFNTTNATGTSDTYMGTVDSGGEPYRHYKIPTQYTSAAGGATALDLDSAVVVNMIPTGQSGGTEFTLPVQGDTQYTFSTYAAVSEGLNTPVPCQIILKDNSTAPADAGVYAAGMLPVEVKTAFIATAIQSRVSLSITTGWNATELTVKVTQPPYGAIQELGKPVSAAFSKAMCNVGGLTSYYPSSSPTYRSIHQQAATCAVAVSTTRILEAHRSSTVSFSTLCAPYLDVTYRAGVNTPRVQASGKVRQVTHEFDFNAGSAVTAVSLAIFQRGRDGWSTPFNYPGKLAQASDLEEGTEDVIALTLGGGLGTNIGLIPNVTPNGYDYIVQNGVYTPVRHPPVYGLTVNSAGAVTSPDVAMYGYTSDEFKVYTLPVPAKLTNPTAASGGVAVDIQIPQDTLILNA